MLPPLPRCSGWAYSSLIHPAVSAFPERVVGSACTSSFSRLARRSLTLRPAHSRGHLFVTRYPKASDISSPPCLLRLLPAGAISPGGACTHWKAPPCHGAHPKPTLRLRPGNGSSCPLSGHWPMRSGRVRSVERKRGGQPHQPAPLPHLPHALGLASSSPSSNIAIDGSPPPTAAPCQLR